MSMFAALNAGNYPGKGIREIDTKLVERIMRERRKKGLKPSYIEKPLYYDPEEPDDGCFELDLGNNPDDCELAYDYGYPLLTD